MAVWAFHGLRIDFLLILFGTNLNKIFHTTKFHQNNNFNNLNYNALILFLILSIPGFFKSVPREELL